MTLILGHLEGGGARATGYILGDTAGTDENGALTDDPRCGLNNILNRADEARAALRQHKGD